MRNKQNTFDFQREGSNIVYLNTDNNVDLKKRMLDIDSQELRSLYKPKLSNDFLFGSNTISSLSNLTKGKPSEVSLFESSTTLQQSSIAYTIPKTKRFRVLYDQPLINFVNQTIHKKDSNKGASMGYGKKEDLSIKSRINVPASNNYEIKSIFEKNLTEKKGISMARRYYSKEKFINPGPGSYEKYNLNFGKYRIKIGERNDFIQGKM